MEHFAGRVAAITGAASGIGRALADELTRRGAHVALADVDEAGLAATVAACEGRGPSVTPALVDVADRPAVEAWATEVVATHGTVHLVVNNAGVALGATVASMAHEDLEWLMGVNFWGVVHGTGAFLPHLRAAGEGHVVNLSSVFGLVALPTQSAYAAAKFAVRAYTDALRVELEIEQCGVSATTVHPGGVRTNIVRNARIHEDLALASGRDNAAAFDRIARTSPEQAATRILEAVRRDRARVLVGPDAWLFDLLARLPPGVSRRLLVAAGRRRARRAP